MEKKEGFFRSIGKANSYVVLNTFYAYFAQGIVVVMLGSILPALKEAYSLNYQVGGMLLSMTSVGYAVAGLGAGFLPMMFGLKNCFITLTAPLALGMAMLLMSGNPIWLLAAMFLVGINKGAVTNYNNLIVSRLAKGSAGPLNLLHACFAVGACLAPIAVLLCGKFDASGWRAAVTISVIIAAAGVILMLPMKLENTRAAKSTEKEPISFGFFKEKIFWICVIICFLYQCIEASLMGWLTTFFVDSAVMTESFAQIVTSTLWISLLLGRLSCSAISKKFQPKQLLMILAMVQAIFLVWLVSSHSFGCMILATVGLGLGMSGMYGTCVSNAGDLFERYPVCMGFFVLMTSMGAVIAPSAIGMIANVTDIRTGLTVLIVAAVALLMASAYNLLQGARRRKGVLAAH